MREKEREREKKRERKREREKERDEVSFVKPNLWGVKPHLSTHLLSLGTNKFNKSTKNCNFKTNSQIQSRDRFVNYEIDN